MIEFELSTSLLCFLIPLLLIIFLFIIPTKSINKKLPKSYPLIGSILAVRANSHRRIQWTSDVTLSTPTSTFVLPLPLNRKFIFTANPANVQHMLKTKFSNYQKGFNTRETFRDFMGDGIFNTDGQNWKFQRQIASHQFNTSSLRNFVENVVDAELSDRLIPIFSDAAKNGTVIELQDLLQRFAFDNVCKISFGYDPAYLSPSLPDSEFAVAFETAVGISSDRLNNSFHPLVWKFRKLLDIGSEKKLRVAVKKVRDLAKRIIREKKDNNNNIEMVDLLSRFLSSGHSDADFVTDVVISFILAGRDTTSAALVWFFWLVFKHPRVENEIMNEIEEKPENPIYEEVKDMVYTHASLSETMRLYPPVPIDGKNAMEDDILPDGTKVKKGTRVAYHPYAMGRSEKLWGPDWAQFRPERFLDRDGPMGKWNYVAKDPYTFSVFQAGPRICLGKEMAYLQMKRVIACVLRRFQIVPALEKGAEPVFIAFLTSKMEGGFPVRIEERRRKFEPVV